MLSLPGKLPQVSRPRATPTPGSKSSQAKAASKAKQVLSRQRRAEVYSSMFGDRLEPGPPSEPPESSPNGFWSFLGAPDGEGDEDLDARHEEDWPLQESSASNPCACITPTPTGLDEPLEETPSPNYNRPEPLWNNN
eukprot:3699674-Pyramimonas_sp.AAC.1